MPFILTLRELSKMITICNAIHHVHYNSKGLSEMITCSLTNKIVMTKTNISDKKNPTCDIHTPAIVLYRITVYKGPSKNVNIFMSVQTVHFFRPPPPSPPSVQTNISGFQNMGFTHNIYCATTKINLSFKPV